MTRRKLTNKANHLIKTKVMATAAARAGPGSCCAAVVELHYWRISKQCPAVETFCTY